MIMLRPGDWVATVWRMTWPVAGNANVRDGVLLALVRRGRHWRTQYGAWRQDRDLVTHSMRLTDDGADAWTADQARRRVADVMEGSLGIATAERRGARLESVDVNSGDLEVVRRTCDGLFGIHANLVHARRRRADGGA